jgi:hypothetical protein
VLLEIATDDPGFTLDEAEGTLGDAIMLPPRYTSPGAARSSRRRRRSPDSRPLSRRGWWRHLKAII